MKKANIILASVAILATIGGALAFKASRFNPADQLWTVNGTKLSTTNVGGVIYSTIIPNCTLTPVFRTTLGTPVNTSTSSTRANVTTAFTNANQPLPFVTTYTFCTLTVTATTLANE